MAFAEQYVRRPQSVWLRKALFQVHLWTGIGIGLYAAALSISGSVLFFRSIVLESVPGRKVVQGSGPLLTKVELTEAATRAYPDFKVSKVWEGRQPGQEVEIWMDRGSAQKQRIFDPYTGRDLGEAVPFRLRAISWLLDLHVNLLVGPKGRTLNGVGGILLTLLCLTGAVIWWPGIKNWRRSMLVNPKANWKRLNWELHSAIGFWTFTLVFMWSFTGIYLVFPDPFQSVIHRIAPLDFYRPISFEAEPSLAGATLVRVADEAPKAKGRRRRPAIHYSAGDQIIRVFYGAHFGNFAGVRTRIAWAVFGLAPMFLFGTGVLMWWNRVLGKEARKLRRPTELSAPPGLEQAEDSIN